MFGLTNFDEFDLVFLSLPYVQTELSAQKPNAEVIGERLSQLDEWVQQGNTLVLSNAMPTWIHPLGHFLDAYEPFSGLQFQQVEGARMEVCGPQEASQLLSQLTEYMSYSFILNSDELKPLLRVKAANKNAPIQILGGVRQRGDGKIIYLPNISANAGSSTFVAATVRELVASLTRREPDSLPDWVQQFRSESEHAARSKIAALQTEVARIETEIAGHQVAIDDAAHFKQLIAGSGQGFAEAAASALKELGLRVIEGRHPRADFVVADGVRIAAVEVKGVEGPIAERHLRQLVAWMTEIDHILSLEPNERTKEQKDYADALSELQTPVGELDCKGLLIVGTFRNTPLDNREQPDVPDSVQRRFGSSDVCVLTGCQLLGLVLAGRRDAEIKPVLVEELMSTQGRLRRALNWNEFLHVR